MKKKEMKKMCANSNTSQGHYVLLVPFFNTSVYIFSLHFFFSGDLFMFYLSVIFIVLLLTSYYVKKKVPIFTVQSVIYVAPHNR